MRKKTKQILKAKQSSLTWLQEKGSQALEVRSRTITPLHSRLRRRWFWYDQWHNHPHHKKAHWGILGFYLVIAVATLGIVKMAYAADFTDIWNFSSSSDYALSDSNYVEITGGKGRLKALNYASDGQTAALYHFDDNTGTTASDSASGNNTASFVGTPSWVTGNLDKALSFNGVSQQLTVNDSASLSITGQQSLEAWIKPNALFSSSSSQSQTILDKGSYRLGLDRTSGKVAYEIENNNSEQWTKRMGAGQAGSWSFYQYSLESMTSYGSDIYAGTGPIRGDAEVWKWNGTTWAMIGGEGLNGSWPDQTYEQVTAIATHGTNLYAGLGNTSGDGEVWTCNLATNCTSWTKVGGDGLGIIAGYNTINAFSSYGGSLYAGTGNAGNNGDLWRYNGGTSWTQVGGDNLNGSWALTGIEQVASLNSDGTYLYVGLGLSINDADVWRYNGTTWTQIGGDGLNSGWTSGYETVRSMTSFGGNLYVGLGDGAQEASVWRFNGTTWTQIGGNPVASSWNSAAITATMSLANDGTNLYAGNGTGASAGEVYRWNGSNAWTRIGGAGTNGSWSNSMQTIPAMVFANSKLYAAAHNLGGIVGSSMWEWTGTAWTNIGGNFVNNSWGGTAIGRVDSSTTMNGKLYIGLGRDQDNAQVYEYDGNTTRRVGGSGLAGSWAANTYESINSMTSYKGELYVGLASSAADGEVWKWNGTIWTKIGGDGINSAWGTSNEDSVRSMTVWRGDLYVGLGRSSYHADIWRWNGTTWTQVAGEPGSTTGTGVERNGSWKVNPRSIETMVVYNDQLCIGTGGTGGYGEVWCWNGTGNWVRISGGNNSSLNGSWTSAAEINQLSVFNGKLYAGLQTTGQAAAIWEWDGSAWTKIAGGDVGTTWSDGTYTYIRSFSVYNGALYSGVGFSGAGNPTGDVWRYNGSSWSQVGGDGINNSWAVADSREEVTSLITYKGKLYAGLGTSPNLDALMYSFGNNGYIESTTSSISSAWHHVAGTYDGVSMKLYIDGVLDATVATSASGVDNSLPLKIGSGWGSAQSGDGQSYFDGILDEVRISNTARTSFTSKPYSSARQTIGLGSASRTSGVSQWVSFTASETANGGTVTYRLSDDGGTSWKYWTGSAWLASTALTEANPSATINSQIGTFPVTFSGIKWQAILSGDGSQQVTINSVEITSNADSVAPDTNASALLAKKSQSGSALASNAWTNGASPYFSWTAATDSGSGIKGYCLYLGTDNTANPVTSKGLLGTSPAVTGGNCQFMVTSSSIDLATSSYLAAPLTTSNSPYYLSVRAIDNAGNVHGSNAQFYFRFDNTPPTNPGYITAPSSFINTKTATLTWPTSGGSAASDANSGLAGLQYRINNATWYGDGHVGSQDISDLLTNDGSYTTVNSPDFSSLTDGINTVNFRTYDQAGNVTTTYVNAELKINTSGAPTPPQNVVASPTTNTDNAFGFNWDAPSVFVGSASSLTYCYSINVVPSSNNCTYTAAGVTQLNAGPYATQPGTNTFYVVARDESSNINYATYATATFQANTVAPGIATSVDIVDVSVKTTSNWRLALTWDPPASAGSGVATYKIYRSINNTTYSLVGTSGSTTYIDAGLTQQIYYYRIQACDSTNNCGANSAAVSKLPTGKFTEAASLVTEPSVSNISTRRATITWVTNRASDSRVAIGTKSGEYASSEIANSDQTSVHTLDLANLQAGTTYFFVTKWTDADGNIGTSSEYSFATAPAPTVKEVTTSQIGLNSATIQFTTKSAVQAKVYFGQTDGFGGVKLINTALAESSYSTLLPGLLDGTKYYYTIATLDSEGNEYGGNTYSFTTPPRPTISNLTLQPLEGEPTSTQRVGWTTNVPTTSQVVYGKVGGDTQEVITSGLVTEHEIIIRGLEDSSQYSLVARSRDGAGNEASSDTQVFKTELDTRPPKISDLVVESTIRGTGSEARGQIVVSWRTDEPSTSQVAFGEGSDATNIRNQTAEDASLTTEHLVIISDLSTAKPYTVQALSRDRGSNQAKSDSQTALIGRASDSVLSIIFNTLQRMFGFVGN